MAKVFEGYIGPYAVMVIQKGWDEHGRVLLEPIYKEPTQTGSPVHVRITIERMEPVKVAPAKKKAKKA
jgi:hypothetical protein